VTEVVLGEEDLVPRHPQPLLDQRAHPELVEQPGERGLAEQLDRPREHLQRRHQDPLELEERLLEERHVVQVVGGDPLGGEDVLDGVDRELVVVLLAREALLLGGGHDHAVAQEGGRRVVEEAGDPQDVHD
jgi:hypothetical protein